MSVFHKKLWEILWIECFVSVCLNVWMISGKFAYAMLWRQKKDDLRWRVDL